MIKPLAFAALAALALGTAQAGADEDFNKEAALATYLPDQAATTAAVTPHDLLLDTGFAGTGIKAFWPPNSGTWDSSGAEDAVKVLPWAASVTVPSPPVTLPPTLRGYYVVGKQKALTGNTVRVMITRYYLDGTVDSTFGTNGWIFNDSNNKDVLDAVIVGSKAYVLANIDFGGIPTAIVRCIELDTPTGSNCFSLFAGVLPFGATTTGPRTAAYGQRLAYDSRFGLFVAARVSNTASGQEVGIARIDMNGSLVTSFGTNGYTIGLPAWANTPNATAVVNALAVTPAGTTGGTRLYVGGQLSVTSTDTDGFVLGLGPDSGTAQTGWNWNDHAIYYENDNGDDDGDDAVTALTILRNGKILLAGWSASDDADSKPLFLGRYNSNGTWDLKFCSGASANNFRACLVDRPMMTIWGPYKPNAVPVAVMERRQNRDVVVVQRFQDKGQPVLTPPAGSPAYDRVRTLVQQFSANGSTLHATRTIDVPGYDSAVQWSRPFAAWMGGMGIWIADEGSGVGEEVLAIAGTRLYQNSDFDATLSHLKSTDSIFADQFGGAHSD